MTPFRVRNVDNDSLLGYAVAAVMYPENGGTPCLVIVWDGGGVSCEDLRNVVATQPKWDLGAGMDPVNG